MTGPEQHDPVFVVAQGGYRVDHRRQPDGRRSRWLMPRDLGVRPIREGHELAGRAYDPWDEGALFRRFADLPLPLSDEDAVGFADEYGVLGLGGPPSDGVFEAESLGSWEEAVFEMSSVVEIWEAWRSGADRAGVLQLLAELRQRAISAGRPADSPGLPDLPADLSRQSDRETAMLIIATAVNRRTEAAGGGGVIVVPGTDTKFFVIETGLNLHSLMWIQFARALVSNPAFQRCATCRRWMEIAPGAGTVRRAFCRPTCRTAAARERKRAALRLHAQGVEPAAIAEELGSGVATIERWVAEAQRSEASEK